MEGGLAFGGFFDEDDVKKAGFGDVVDALRPVGEAVPVVEQDADDFAEAKGDDGEVVAAQAQDGEAEEEAEDAGDEGGKR